MCSSDLAASAGGGAVRVVPLGERRDAGRPVGVIDPTGVAKADKADLLARADAAARAESGAIRSVTATYADARRRILVANSEGLHAADEQVRTRLAVQCVAVGDAGMQTGYEAPGRTMGMELFDEIDPAEIGSRAARDRKSTRLNSSH